MFRNLTWIILAYYVITVFLVVGGLYYFVVVLGFQQIALIAAVTFFLTTFMGIIMAALALEPLRGHFSALERFVKETLHELNLPVNTITANASMLKKNQNDPKILKRIERIEMAAQMLQERYNELNYLIKKQMHQEEIEMFDLKEVIKERIAFLQPLYTRVHFELDLESLLIVTDQRGIAKVIDNLVENAVKYSPHSDRIELIMHHDTLQIIDYGQGMDQVTLLHIFDHYYQNDATMPGFGIGLGLVKGYCDRYKIGLHVSSKEGEGTKVTLNFREVKA